MQVFGVAGDIDACSRRRRVHNEEAVASRAEVGRRAADYGDIVDIPGKRHFPSSPPSKVCVAEEGPWAPDATPEVADIQRRRRTAKVPGRADKVAVGVLPFDAESYDTKSRRQFFDGQGHADRYADLLGRPERYKGKAAKAVARQQAEVPQLPLSIRRALEAALPGASDPHFPQDVNNRIRAQVEAQVLQRYARTKVRMAMAHGPQSPAKPRGARLTEESTYMTNDSMDESSMDSTIALPTPEETGFPDEPSSSSFVDMSQNSLHAFEEEVPQPQVDVVREVADVTHNLRTKLGLQGLPTLLARSPTNMKPKAAFLPEEHAQQEDEEQRFHRVA